MLIYLSLLAGTTRALASYLSFPSVFRVYETSDIAPTVPDVKVPVQLGVMSRCPDALICESVFDEVLKTVGDKVNMSLVYVARLDPSVPVFGVRCLHGVDECAGNVQQLCVEAHATKDQWWEFVQCHNFQGRTRIGLPEVALNCAETAGIDWETSGVGKCAGFDGSGSGEEGIELLKKSVFLGRQLGISKSCTILINHRKTCVHDGTWKECEGGHQTRDFVKQIEDEYRRLNSGGLASGTTEQD